MGEPEQEQDRELPGGVVLEGEVILRREADGRVVIVQAPPIARMSLELLASADPVTVRVRGRRISFGGQVTYVVAQWDFHQACLLLERDDGAGLPVAGFPPGAGTKGA